MNLENDKVSICVGNNVITLDFTDFESTINVDQLTKIDYSNIHAELLTTSALMNRIGIMRASLESIYEEAKLELKIHTAELYEKKRIQLAGIENNSKKWPSESRIQAAIDADHDQYILSKKVIRHQKEFNFIDSLYWAIKSKDNKLSRISERMNLTPEDFAKEILTDTWNGILIRNRQALINSSNT